MRLYPTAIGELIEVGASRDGPVEIGRIERRGLHWDHRHLCRDRGRDRECERERA